MACCAGLAQVLLGEQNGLTLRATIGGQVFDLGDVNRGLVLFTDLAVHALGAAGDPLIAKRGPGVEFPGAVDAYSTARKMRPGARDWGQLSLEPFLGTSPVWDRGH